METCSFTDDLPIKDGDDDFTDGEFLFWLKAQVGWVKEKHVWLQKTLLNFLILI